jgi:hypothetical protein
MSDTLRRQVVYHSGFSLTRIMVHAACLLRGPGKAAFFFAGIRRELSLLHHVKGAFIAAMFTTVLTLSAGWRYFWLLICLATFGQAVIAVVLFFRSYKANKRGDV